MCAAKGADEIASEDSEKSHFDKINVANNVILL